MESVQVEEPDMGQSSAMAEEPTVLEPVQFEGFMEMDSDEAESPLDAVLAEEPEEGFMEMDFVQVQNEMADNY